VSVAERLSGANGGRFCWVSDYTGIYSSTNLVYPDGTTNTFNAALVQSCNLDSDGDGLVNCVDPTPILRPQDIALAVAFTASPSPGARVSWQGVPNSTNKLYFKSASSGSNWQLLTNFVMSSSGPARVSVFDPSGKKIEQIEVPEDWSANVCYGGKDRRTLFITASKGFYGIRMLVRGVDSQ